jgi:hypothetical protein
MERTPVQSSAVKSVGFDEQTGELEVEYRSGYVYRHGGFERQDFDALLGAESVGKHMNVLKAKATSAVRVGEPKQQDATTDAVVG